MRFTLPLFCTLCSITSTLAFQPTPSRSSTPRLFQAADAWSSANNQQQGQGTIEQIEFTIFPDGRVEEVVRGVKGGECNSITEDINAALGEVVASEPTEEMFQEKIGETLYNTETDSGDWEGKSSW